MYVNNRACRPGVSFGDAVAVPIDLQRTIELRPGLDWAFAIILDLPAPENHLAFFIRGLQFQPHIESIHCAAGKEVPDLARAHYNIHARVIAPPHRRIGAIDGSSDGAEFAGGGVLPRNVTPFSQAESDPAVPAFPFAWRPLRA